MKLAWLCWRYDDDGYSDARIEFKEPEPYEYFKVIPIVFMEVVE
jgi:hypothetical protein